MTKTNAQVWKEKLDRIKGERNKKEKERKEALGRLVEAFDNFIKSEEGRVVLEIIKETEAELCIKRFGDDSRMGVFLDENGEILKIEVEGGYCSKVSETKLTTKEFIDEMFDDLWSPIPTWEDVYEKYIVKKINRRLG